MPLPSSPVRAMAGGRLDEGGQRICLLATKTHKLTIKGRPKPFEWTHVVTRCSPASQCEHFHGYLEK